MLDKELDLNWLILNHSEFLQQFGIDRDKIITDYILFEQKESGNSVLDYLAELLTKASLFNIKTADTEERYYKAKLKLDNKALEFFAKLGKGNKNYLLRQIHFDKLMISKSTLPFKFDIQIDSNDCCLYCAKKNKKIFTFEKIIEKQYLPLKQCKREDGCCCSYSVVPSDD